MNYKLEKFWNKLDSYTLLFNIKWTINLKSFEINLYESQDNASPLWTINLKSFEIIQNALLLDY